MLHAMHVIRGAMKKQKKIGPLGRPAPQASMRPKMGGATQPMRQMVRPMNPMLQQPKKRLTNVRKVS